MKLNYVVLTVAVSMLLGTQAWAEEGMAHTEKNNVATGDISNMNEPAQAVMEQTGDAGTLMQDKKMTEPMAMEQSGFSRGSVVRSVFTSAVEDREPTDNLKELNTSSDKIIYYTELRDMSGQTAIHRWEYNGEVMAEIEFNVGGARWRVWSSKSFVPGWTGEWKVSVLNGASEVISEDILNYSQAMGELKAAPEMEAAPVSPATDSMH